MSLVRIARGLILSLILVSHHTARADAARDFIVSCSYGVLAGTLVGAATLAFSEKPGDNLNKVARGASLGLYAGILLGAFVVYGGGPAEDDEAAALLNQTSLDGTMQPSIRREVKLSLQTYQSPKIQVYPLLTDNGLGGAAVRFRVLSF